VLTVLNFETAYSLPLSDCAERATALSLVDGAETFLRNPHPKPAPANTFSVRPAIVYGAVSGAQA
jgi:hypothetical protein